jgi:hypothetical protein
LILIKGFTVQSFSALSIATEQPEAVFDAVDKLLQLDESYNKK